MVFVWDLVKVPTCGGDSASYENETYTTSIMMMPEICERGNWNAYDNGNEDSDNNCPHLRLLYWGRGGSACFIFGGGRGNGRGIVDGGGGTDVATTTPMLG